MTTKTEQLDRARQFGRDAFHAGKPCAPATDANVLALLEGRQVGVTPEGEAPTLAIFKAWSTGWKLEAMAAV